jgi:hypothetical protein
MNIIKNDNSFQLDGLAIIYTIAEGTPEILCETQCHIPTNYGQTFFDTDVTIEGQSFENIEDWIAELYK